MSQISVGYVVDGGGLSISRTVLRAVDGQNSRGPISLAAGAAGTLTARTDNETGTLTLDPGHGIETGQIVDLYWAGGMRYGITVGTVAGDSVPIGADDSGSGDNLPAQDTVIVCAPRVEINATIDGDALAVAGLDLAYTLPASTAVGHVEFQDGGAATIAAVDVQANSPQVWDVAGGSNNPFTGNPITTLFASNGSATEEATLKLVWGVDSTP